MKKTFVSVVLLFAACAAQAQTVALAPDPRKMSAEDCKVWNAEKSFADSAQRHDAKAFGDLVHPNAVFINNQAPHVFGRAEVVKAWAGIIEGKDIILRWHPDFVAVGGDGNVAMSRGPYWIENPAPEAKQKYLIGIFQSVWVKNKKGQWQVFSDGGGAPPKPATREEVEKLKASLPASCS